MWLELHEKHINAPIYCPLIRDNVGYEQHRDTKRKPLKLPSQPCNVFSSTL